MIEAEKVKGLLFREDMKRLLNKMGKDDFVYAWEAVLITGIPPYSFKDGRKHHEKNKGGK